MPTSIKRIGAPTETRWIICGSYVLDVFFGLSKARDLDVGYDPQLRRPTECEIREHLAKISLPAPPSSIQMIRWHDFSTPEAGGFPCFNIDFWQIHMDGNVYVAEPSTQSHRRLTEADPHTLQIVDANHLTVDCAKRAIHKMQRYPLLRTADIAEKMQDML